MRISATQLDAFHLFTCGLLREAALVDAIQRTTRPTPRMRLGAAFGRVLEHPEAFRFPVNLFGDTAYRVPEYPEFTFPPAMIDPALAAIARNGAVFEHKAARQYGPHTVVAKADHLVAGARRWEHLTEFKTRRGAIEAGRYHRSYQWRFMVDIFRPAVASYRVFRLTVRPMRLVEMQAFTVYHQARQHVIHRQCCALLARFVQFVEARGLERWLVRREERPAPPAPPAWSFATEPAFEDAPTRPSTTAYFRRLRERLRRAS